MKFEAVVTSHLNPTLSGVAKFNLILAEQLGVPCIPLESLSAQISGPLLLSVKLRESPYKSAADVARFLAHLSERGISFDLFLHAYDALEAEDALVKQAGHVFCSDEEIRRQLDGKHSRVIASWCPALLKGPSRFTERSLNLFSFGMAHKIQVMYYRMLRDLLEKNQIDYTLRLSTAFHEKANFGDFDSISRELGDLFADRIQFLGFLSDDAVNDYLSNSHLFLAFFDKGVRSNNTSIYAAMKRGRTVLTNCDDCSPTWMQHGENILDIHMVKKIDLDPRNLRQIGEKARVSAERFNSWGGLIDLLSEPDIPGREHATSRGLPQNVPWPSMGQLLPGFLAPGVKSRDELSVIVKALRGEGKTIAFTSGIFDILHVGHVRFLRTAKALADVLIVALNTDYSTRQVKGPDRPVVSQRDRAELLLALNTIDYIVLQEAVNSCSLLEQFRPDIYIKGEDYTTKDDVQWPEQATVRKFGGAIKLISYEAGKSTTSIIEKIKRTNR